MTRGHTRRRELTDTDDDRLQVAVDLIAIDREI